MGIAKHAQKISLQQENHENASPAREALQIRLAIEQSCKSRIDQKFSHT